VTPPPPQTPAAQAVRAVAPALSRGPATARWLNAVARTSRPRQWPKNLLVLAAPLAGASLGRDDGASYALVALAAFTSASCAVYFVNDVADAGRDRLHPAKRHRPVAAGVLPAGQALALGVLAAVASLACGLWIGEPGLSVAVGVYLALSFAYSAALKHVPAAELLFVASGFLLRALGGAAATHVPPSGWFLTVCSLGALTVAIAKRRTELAALGPEAAKHRPVMRYYRYGVLRTAGRAVTVAVIIAYSLWAIGSPDGRMRAWHMVSIAPLAASLIRFDWLAGHVAGRPVEDLIIRDQLMAATGASWLIAFTLGL
jgi:decaprenyl-phosphate phosphoribosyltransferase